MRLGGLNLNLLIVLDVLLETRSVSRAAERLGRSQSTISGSLQLLREHFKDELLINVGRKMVLTARAEELTGTLRAALQGLESVIAGSAGFAPAVSERHFNLITTDYAFDVLLADAMRDFAKSAPGVTFSIAPPSQDAPDRLERGMADALISIEALLPNHLARRRLFDDQHAVVSWTGNRRCSDGLTEALFFELGHVVVTFSPDRVVAYSERELNRLRRPRRPQVSVASFADVPQAVIGTERIGVMYRRHAEKLAATLPLTVHPPPIPLPNVSEAIAFHPMRASDTGLQWLVSALLGHAARLA